MKLFSKPSVWFLFILMSGCSADWDEPKDVIGDTKEQPVAFNKMKEQRELADKFWKEIFSNGIIGTREYTTKDSQAKIDAGMKMKFSGEYTLYEMDGDENSAIAYMHMSNGDEWPTILVKSKGEWKVDVVQMTDEMYGDKLPPDFMPK